MNRFILTSNGTLCDENGKNICINEIADTQITVPHLAPHVIKIAMPRGEYIKIKIIYSSHCWSSIYDCKQHNFKTMIIKDNSQKRIFDAERFKKSRILPEFLAQLSTHRLYLTPSDRNYGVYNASMIVDDFAYTVFFTMKKNKGRLNGIRHSLLMRVESAYHAPQPSKGMKTNIFAVIDKALKGEKLKYR